MAPEEKTCRHCGSRYWTIFTEKSNEDEESMTICDVVSWDSQAGGRWTKKTGAIVEIVPRGLVPRHKIRGSGQPRSHESYVVDVFGTLYWPRVSNLKPVNLPDASPWNRPGHVEDEDSIPEGATNADPQIPVKTGQKRDLTRRGKRKVT